MSYRTPISKRLVLRIVTQIRGGCEDCQDSTATGVRFVNPDTNQPVAVPAWADPLTTAHLVAPLVIRCTDCRMSVAVNSRRRAA